VFRWYRAGWGRYTQADPLGLRADVNLFRYGVASPLVNIDRLGLVVWNCDISAVSFWKGSSGRSTVECALREYVY
jgi:uncharacterized protein RhaS with RHS repeats